MNSNKEYSVRVARCSHRAPYEEIYATLCRIIEPLERAKQKLKAAHKIVIKTNMAMPKEQIAYFEGKRRELVDDDVMRAVLTYLSENTSAQLVATDTTFGDGLNYLPLLEEFGVQYVDSDTPIRIYDVPGGGIMFSQYHLSECFADADAVVSVAKMKSHLFTGVTLCMKNLFGLCPRPPLGRPRTYFHHFIRISYVFPDLALLTQPCLNIIDGLVGQSGREWGGEGRIGDVLVAGDQVIATDAVGAWLMGHNPAGDWPHPPFRRERNPIRVAAESGFGTVNLNEIDLVTEIQPPVAEFDSHQTDSVERVINWRKTACEQALFYRDNQKKFVDKYAGQYIYLQAKEVVWNGVDMSNLGSRRQLSGEKKDSALWLKWVDPEEAEGEHFEIYEPILEQLSQM